MADGDFYSKYTGEEIEKKLDGSVLFNAYQQLTEIQKQQARRNIGAGTVDSGLIIKGYYATYEELTAAQPNPQISDAYGVGTKPPYNIFVWDNANKMWVNNGTITKGDKGDPGQDGEAPTAENIAAALGYTPAAADLSNVPDGAVTAAKLKNGAVTRAKLAQDALYSPLGFTSASEKIRRITVNDIGKTLYFSWVSGDSSFDTTFSLSLEDSSKFPTGGEIAICYYHGKSCSISFTGGLKVDIAGEGRADNRTIKIPEKYGMVALKKMFTSNGTDYWLVIGNVEVVG